MARMSGKSTVHVELLPDKCTNPLLTLSIHFGKLIPIFTYIICRLDIT